MKQSREKKVSFLGPHLLTFLTSSAFGIFNIKEKEIGFLTFFGKGIDRTKCEKSSLKINH